MSFKILYFLFNLSFRLHHILLLFFQCDQSLKLEIRPIFAENSHIYSPDFQPQFFPPHFPPQQKNRDFEAKMSLLFVFLVIQMFLIIVEQFTGRNPIFQTFVHPFEAKYAMHTTFQKVFFHLRSPPPFYM